MHCRGEVKAGDVDYFVVANVELGILVGELDIQLSALDSDEEALSAIPDFAGSLALGAADLGNNCQSSNDSRYSSLKDPSIETGYSNRRTAVIYRPVGGVWTRRRKVGGPDRDRTGDLVNAIHARSHLRHWPTPV
jgi:hypothetical protein